VLTDAALCVALKSFVSREGCLSKNEWNEPDFAEFYGMSVKGVTQSLDLWLLKPMSAGHRIAIHVVFWLCYVIYEGLIVGLIDDQYAQHFGISLIELPWKITATYFTLYVLIDRFLIERKYGLFLTLLPLSMIVYGVLFRIMSYYVVYPLYYPAGVNIPLFFPPKILIYIFTNYSLVAVVASFHLIKHWYKNQQNALLLERTAKELEKEKLAAELKLLKSQINPHFLFNTLNNLYVLTLNHSEKSPEVVYKLSQLMSYMLYDSNQAEVLLRKEVEYIENYIALEKIRHSNLDVSLNVFNDLKEIRIAPLLILPFVENSFKHGVSNLLSSGFIRIDISVQEETLVIKVENSKVPPDVPRPTSGIGLKNVKKRLDLIYPDRYSLQFFNEEDFYLVILKIDRVKTQELAKQEEQSKQTEDEMSYR
jgi:two-component system LytT family sensor kinase